jgi:hypothetical protein
MRTHNLCFLLLSTSLATFLPACGDNLAAFPDDTTAILIEASCPGDPAQVVAARLDGTLLVVTAQYGGCARTRVWACWDGQLGAGDPASAEVVIHAEPAGDCDASFEQSATISLDPMLDGEPVMIHAGGHDLLWRP